MSALCLYDGLEALCTVNEIKLEKNLKMQHIQVVYRNNYYVNKQCKGYILIGTTSATTTN